MAFTLVWNRRPGAKKLMGLEPIVNLEEKRASSIISLEGIAQNCPFIHSWYSPMHTPFHFGSLSLSLSLGVKPMFLFFLIVDLNLKVLGLCSGKNPQMSYHP
jgi:hypothetical protein